MSENNDKKYGRTLFDVIAEHPKVTFYFFLSLVVVILVVASALVISGVRFKVGNLEIGGDVKTVPDTVFISKTDTQFVSVPLDKIKLSKSPIFRKKTTSKVSVKSGDTIVAVQNQPANINTGTNNGIIGNDNDVQINVNEIQRKLNEPNKLKLLALINQSLEKDISSRIEVSAVVGSSEAFNFANEILQFLTNQNLVVENYIGQFQQSPPVKGVEVGFNKHKKCVTVMVGYK